MRTFDQLNSDLMSQAETLVASWLPSGKLKGREYVCGNLRGDAGDSLSINLDSGRWADFATGEKGGDLVSLYAAINGVGQGEAAKALAGEPPSGSNGSGGKRGVSV